MINQNLLLAGDDGYNFNKSLRFRSSASAYLSRTATIPTLATKFSVSFWTKIGLISSARRGLVGSLNSAGTSYWVVEFSASNGITVYDSNGSAQVATSAVYRDPAAWYHIVVAVDTTQATASNRILLYVNGIQITAFSTAVYPTQNSTPYIQISGVAQSIASEVPNATPYYYDGYMTEVNFIDGQALTPTSFGSFNTLTGVWQPAKYTGTYGTNGFYLPFTNTTSTSTLGNDFSGNGNNWTANNFSLTTGTTYDSMTDVPTLTSATTANYCVLNPLDYESSTFTLSNANLTFAGARTASGSYYTRSTVAVTSGKWYWEVTPTDVGAGPNLAIGIQSLPSALTGGGSLMLNGYGYSADGNKYNNAGSSAYGASWTNGDVIGIAYDATAGTITFYKNNTSQGTAFTGITAGTYTPVIEMSTGGVARTVAGSVNFGQQPFTYTPPTGFVALNTFNLPTSTIVKGNTVMDAQLYTGNGSSQTLTTTSGFKPDLVWIKQRSAATGNDLTDTVRGATITLQSQDTAAEETRVNDLTAFTSTGFSVGSGGNVNTNSGTYVAWEWQAGQGTTSSNTAGSITSTVSANPTAGFSIVTYTGTGSNATVGHGLGVAPKMIIIKSRSNTSDWIVYNSNLTSASYRLFLSDTTGQDLSTTTFNSTAPTSSVFSLGTNANVNSSGWTQVAYCWTPIAGYSAFGSYTGNGSSDGPFIYTGFRPKFWMVKNTTTGGTSWVMVDTSRSPYNVANLLLLADSSGSEVTTNTFDILSNGIKLRSTDGSRNANGDNYIYMAFAENPMKYSLAR